MILSTLTLAILAHILPVPPQNRVVTPQGLHASVPDRAAEALRKFMAVHPPYVAPPQYPNGPTVVFFGQPNALIGGEYTPWTRSEPYPTWVYGTYGGYPYAFVLPPYPLYPYPYCCR